jgi:heptosyltransferase-1
MKFLIVKCSALGDIIHSFPVVNYLKKRFPTCEIDWIVEEAYASLVQAHPLVRRVLTISTKKWKKRVFHYSSWQSLLNSLKRLREQNYDVLFDLQGNTKSAVITSFARAKDKIGYAWKDIAEFPAYFASKTRFNVSSSMGIQQMYLSLPQQYFKDHEPFQTY